jgi:2-oxoglutarate dehydrogenase E1 component
VGRRAEGQLDRQAEADDKIKRVVICSGKVYYDLLAERDARGMDDTYLLRSNSSTRPGPVADPRTWPLQEGRIRLVPGRAEEPGRLVLHRAELEGILTESVRGKPTRMSYAGPRRQPRPPRASPPATNSNSNTLVVAQALGLN